MFDLTGKTALVTGSSRGIGKAILLAYAKQGAKVILHASRPSEKAEATVSELKAMGADFDVFYQDLSPADGSNKLWEAIKAKGLSIDILVLNASVEIRNKWCDIPDDQFDLQINTNLRAPMKMMQLVIPTMQQKGWGRVIVMGSVQQIKPNEAMWVYSACKSALHNMVISLAPMLAPCGVTINTLAPGAIRTDRNAEALSDPAYEKHVESLIPMNYIGKADDVSGLAVFLASEESKYMTGECIYIAGGKDL